MPDKCSGKELSSLYFLCAAPPDVGPLLPDYPPFGYIIQYSLKGPLLTMHSCNLPDTQRYSSDWGGLQHHPRCLLCDQMPETMHHLVLACPFVKQVWHDVLVWLRIPCRPPDDGDMLDDWCRAARHDTPKPMHKGLASIALLVPWMTWKHRNDCVFNHSRPSIPAVVNAIKDEATQWARAGAKGLRVILPTTWDD